jgi:hypothetical protein
MKMLIMKKVFIIGIYSLLILSEGCVQKTFKAKYTPVAKGMYDSEYPYKSSSTELEQITHMVTKVYYIVYYKTYQFNQNSRIRQHELASGNFKNLASTVSDSRKSYSGTATIISFEKNHLALLTCAHIISSPDTIISFFDESEGISTENIKSITIRQKQEILLKDIPSCGDVNILAIDRENDIAIIGKKCEDVTETINVFSYPTGKAKDLRWGCFVYIIGYPLGNIMVTSGLVSEPNSDEYGTFLIDALFNKGFSGGIVLAIKDGVPNFELVGIVNSVSSKTEYVLKPEKQLYEYYYDEKVPYKGELNVGTQETINYGITFAIPMEKVRSFYLKNRNELYSQGYDLDGFFRINK